MRPRGCRKNSCGHHVSTVASRGALSATLLSVRLSGSSTCAHVGATAALSRLYSIAEYGGS